MAKKSGLPVLVLFLSLFTLFSCNKDEEHDPITLPPNFYNYYPLNDSSYKIYDADSLIYTTDRKKVHFQLKEVIAGFSMNSMGEKVYRIERYTRKDSLHAWSQNSVYTTYRTSKEAIRNEGNINYVKLTFPIKSDITWNADKYNTKDSFTNWRSSYKELHVPFQLGNLSFDSTILVELKNDEDFISITDDHERYAANVGLISKERIEIEIQPGQKPDDPSDTSGFIYNQYLREFIK